MSNTPSDAEIEKLAAEHFKAFSQFPMGGQVWFEGEVEFARAALARWGTPAGAGAPDFYTACAWNDDRGDGRWTALPGALPEPGVPVLLDIGKKYPIRALWAAKHTVEAADDDTDWAEYDEATETYYCPEGWYEWNEHEEIHWAVTEMPRAWARLPPTTPAGSGKGE